jgi:predicted cobalt transporter CbtA
MRLLGVMMIVLPHFIGAPAGEELSALPVGLPRSFALGSLAVSLVMWVVIGIVTAAVMTRNLSSSSISETASSPGT